MAEKRVHRELFYLNCVLFRRQDLVALAKMLIDDPDTDRIKVQVDFDSTSITAESMEELLGNQDLPPYTDKVSVGMLRLINTPEYRDFPCGISLTLHHNYVSCHIHSLDQTWFLGKKSAVEKFFRLRRPWYALLNKSAPAFPAVVLVLLGYGQYMFMQKNYREMILPVVCSVVLAAATTLIFKQRLFPFVRVFLKETNDRIRLGFNEWCALIGAISGLATIVQLVVAALK